MYLEVVRSVKFQSSSANMITSELLFALIGILLFKPIISAATNYEPIKITVNENFYTQPGLISPELQVIQPGVLHQGANFYFKPQLQLPQSIILSHVEDLISMIHQNHQSCTKDASEVAADKVKLMEILKTFMYPLSDISKNTLSDIVFEKENKLEILKPSEIISPALEKIVEEPVQVITIEKPKPLNPELLVIPEAPVLPPLTAKDIKFVEEGVKFEEPIERDVILEAPVLPYLSLHDVPFTVEEEITNEESVLVEGQKGVFPSIPEIEVRPIQESSIEYVEPKSIITKFEVIPEAPVLPPLSANDIKLVEEGIKFEEPIVIDIESKPTVQELALIPQAPELTPLPYHNLPSIVEEEITNEESVLVEGQKGVFPSIPEIVVRPIQESGIKYFEPKSIITKFEVIPEVPVLPPHSANYIKLVEDGIKFEEPIVVDIESKPTVQKLALIPQAPELTPLPYHNVPSIVEEEITNEESVLVEGQKGVFPSIPEIVVRPIQESSIGYVEPKSIITKFEVIPEAPVLPPLSANNIKLIEEGIKFKEPIVVDIESNPAGQELAVIPQAPELTPLPYQNLPSIVEEEITNEESVLVEGQKGVFPSIPEIVVRPIQESSIEYVEPKSIITKFEVIPEAPVLPLLSANDIKLVEEGIKFEEPIIVDIESNPAVQELALIPQAPELTPLPYHNLSSIVEEEITNEESVLVEGQKGVFPSIPEIVVRPIQESSIEYVEPKSVITKFEVIPEAPVLPLLSANDIKLVEEGIKFEEPIVVDIESNPAVQELALIPQAPELTPLPYHNLPSIVEEEITNEESVLVEGQKGVFPSIPEIVVRPIQESSIEYVEPKSIITKFEVIPEAPVLPLLSANDIKLVEEGIKFEEPIVVDIESNPAVQELALIPQAPELTPLPYHNLPSIVEEEITNEESVLVEGQKGVFPSIPEIVVRPIQESSIEYVEPKSIITKFEVIPEAPVLPLLSANDIKLVEEGIKFKEPIVVDIESNPAVQELAVIPQAPELTPLPYHNLPSIVEQEITNKESVLVEGQKGVFPSIPEIVVRPIQESSIEYVEPKSVITKFEVIPEAPVLPLLSANDIKLVEEGIKFEEPIVVDIESNPAVQELALIPQAPELTPLPYHNLSSIVEEEITNEESVLVEGQKGVFPSIPEIVVRPIQESSIEYVEPKSVITKFEVIPEAPVLPLLSANDIKLVEEGIKFEEPIVVDIESNPAVQELALIPQAPELTPLPYHNLPSIVEEEITNEESVLVEGQKGVFPSIPEIVVRPIQESSIEYVEPKSIITKFEVIPEAPVLPLLSANDIELVEEGIKFEEPIVVDIESNPAVQELALIPQAPELTPLPYHNLPSIVEEEITNEESVLVEGQKGVFPSIPEIVVRPIQESSIEYVEPKSIITKFEVIPEAPVLPLLSANDIKLVEEGIKFKEPIVVDIESNPAVQELAVIPQAPELTPLPYHNLPSIVEQEITNKESVLVEGQKGVFPSIPEIVVRPIQEEIIDYVEPKASEFENIPQAPILPSLSFNAVTSEVEEESVVVQGQRGVFPSVSEISAGPMTQPILVTETAKSFALENNVYPNATDVKTEIPFEESFKVLPPIAEISSRTNLEPILESEMTNSFMLKELSQPNTERVRTVKETLPPTFILKPSNNLGVFSYAPFVSHLSNQAPKTKKLAIARPASLERFLLKKHQLRLPVTPFPKPSVDAMKSIWGNQKQFWYPTSYAHDVVEKRIAPNMAFKNNASPKRVKIYVRSEVPKRPSKL